MAVFDVIVIGGGPAGMTAAVSAAQKGRKVLLLERNGSLGRKLLISGNGRCNLTNSRSISEFLEKFSSSRDFLRNAFAKFFKDDLEMFFAQSRLKLKTEMDGRIFPRSEKAGDVLRVLEEKLRKNDVCVLLNQRVEKILIDDGKVSGVRTFSKDFFHASKVVVATGGASYPATGSCGDGYKLAGEAGHDIRPLYPALVPVRLKEKFLPDWQGIALHDINVTLFSGGKKAAESRGDMIFTHFGVSGPLVFDLSAGIYAILQEGKEAVLGINFLPGMNSGELGGKLRVEFCAHPKKNIKNIFPEFLPRHMISGFLNHLGIEAEKPAGQITAKERQRLVNGLSDLKLKVSGLMPLKESIVTGGGVNTREINPKTMESRLVSGLYFAGEVIDVDAKTGGYNMQAVFSTGWVCGNAL